MSYLLWHINNATFDLIFRVLARTLNVNSNVLSSFLPEKWTRHVVMIKLTIKSVNVLLKYIYFTILKRILHQRLYFNL